MLPVFAQTTTAATASPLATYGLLPSGFEVSRDANGYVVMLPGIAPKQIAGAQTGGNFVVVDLLDLVGDDSGENGPWAELRLSTEEQKEPIVVALTNGAYLLLPTSTASTQSDDAQKATANVLLVLTFGSNRVFPAGSTTV